MAKDANKTENISHTILIEPWITEESTRVSQFNKYIFRVMSGASKINVRKSVEEVYKVKVISVRTISVPKKKRVRGRTVGWKAGYKKAIVTLKQGDKIEFFENK